MLGTRSSLRLLQIHLRLISTSAVKCSDWSSSRVRSAFLRYFQNHDHLFVPSSSVIPNTEQGTFFTNAGMNQFKSLFIGMPDPRSEMASYRRVVNSQKCIRVGGKHNDLDDVGHDLTHLTFFEMLGNWSFGDYFKKEACEMALELLTSVYGLPVDRLYFTYFGGCADLDLAPDDECKVIWQSLGIPKERVLPFGMKDNFWDMGATGPCGPCTEIHYDHGGRSPQASLVNTGHSDVVEIWNLVFMQYLRQEDGSLSPLSQRHVDTGMGLERLLALLNGSRSNYDTDLFLPLFATVQKSTGAVPYSGQVGAADTQGVDTAYRILADHARMFTVTIADGLMPSNRGIGFKLRQLIRRSIHCIQKTFNADPQLLCQVVEQVAKSLGDSYPEIGAKKDMVKSTIAGAIDEYLQLQKDSAQTFVKLLPQLSNKQLSGEMAYELSEGKYGTTVPIEMIVQLSKEHDVTLDLQGYDLQLQKRKEQHSHGPIVKKSVLSQGCYQRLVQQGVSLTDDSFKYSYTSSHSGYDFSDMKRLSCQIVGLVQDDEVVSTMASGSKGCVLLDRTCFYAEAGGQRPDLGVLVSERGEFAVEDVQELNGYVLHLGKLQSGVLSTGDTVRPVLSQSEREGCMRNHTATHLLQSSLRQHLHSPVSQHGSSVRPDRLTFDFTCQESLSKEKVEEIEESVRQTIRESHAVSRQSMPLQDALEAGDIITVPGETYPSQVTLVHIAGPDRCVSKELCGGTHVVNTSDVCDFCITKVSSVAQGVKRIAAVTGKSAQQAHQNGAELLAMCEEFSAIVFKGSSATELKEKSQNIKERLKSDVLSHTIRNHSSSVVETLNQYVVAAANKEKQAGLRNMVQNLLHDNAHSGCLVYSTAFDGNQMVKALASLDAATPLALLSLEEKRGVVVMVWPQGQSIQPLEAAVREKLSNLSKWKVTVNKHGATIVQLSVKGSDLNQWLEPCIKDLMNNFVSEDHAIQCEKKKKG